MDEKGLGQRLQEARRRAGLTQQTLCQKANISYSTLAKIERGAIKSPSIFTIQSLAVALGISLDTLMGMTSQAAAVEASHTPVSKNGISFVYFDVNGCLIHFFQRAFTALARDTGASADLIESTFWNYNDDVCRGRMSLHDFNVELAKCTGLDAVDWNSYYLDAVEPIEGMDELVRWAAAHYRVGLLTNIMPDVVPALRARGLLPDVEYDVIIDSSEVGAIKPEARIFNVAAKRAGVKPSEILLIDDDRPNIMAADKLGWHVLWSDDNQPEDTAHRVREVLELR
ncbi:MAG TPA: HAD-IA family hydrolase [Candidatus Saccharimonadales bacterium]|jgi:FMN phosphatase YigB (HAD superfamily)/DNA-binding XRE family transcriptional regulator